MLIVSIFFTLFLLIPFEINSFNLFVQLITSDAVTGLYSRRSHPNLNYKVNLCFSNDLGLSIEFCIAAYESGNLFSSGSITQKLPCCQTRHSLFQH